MTDLEKAAEESGALTCFENGEVCVDPMFEKGWLAARRNAAVTIDESMYDLWYAREQMRKLKLIFSDLGKAGLD